MKIKANAKVNLSLNVVKKRTDGYHELEMIMVPLTLADDLEVVLSDKDELISNVELPPNNTITKALALMRAKYQIKEHFKITLNKVIPSQAGLAGGSSDGAAVLKAINQLLDLKLTMAELLPLAKKVGADVPFCCYNTPALVKGIGEIVEPFTIQEQYYLLLIKPLKGVSTQQAFTRLKPETTIHPDYEPLKHSLESGLPIDGLLANSLQAVAIEMVSDIQRIIDNCQGYNVLMSGSGSTVFVISTNREELIKLHQSWPEKTDLLIDTEIKRD